MRYTQLQEKPTRFIATDPESWNSDVEEGIACTPFKHQLGRSGPGARSLAACSFKLITP